jgi:2'-5' RNA ligase
MITVGVVIDVPEPFAHEIRDARRAWNDPETDLVPPHITLVAPVSVDEDAMAPVESHLMSVCVAARPFDVGLRGTGTFRPVSPVVFLAVAQGISSCEMLESRMRCGPLAVDLRFPYHPHVTVAVDLAPETLDRAYAELGHFEAQFTVDHVSLYELRESGWALRRVLSLDGS